MENSHIEWTDHTWNPWIGCTKVDALCAHCYAEARDIRFADGAHWGKGAPRQRTAPGNWREPYRWNRTHTDALAEYREYLAEQDVTHSVARKEPKSPRVFCASLADWLDDEVPIAWLLDMLRVVHDCRNLTWLLLTKRPENWAPRIEAVLKAIESSDGWDADPLHPLLPLRNWLADWFVLRKAPDHVWMGTSVGDQKSADTRIPILLSIPAKVRFLSCEPLLGPVELSLALQGWDVRPTQPNGDPEQFETPIIDWVIVGGESGANARPMHPNWVRDIRAQCYTAGVKFFFKQWGEWAPAEQTDKTVSVELAQPSDIKNPAWHQFDATELRHRQLMARVGKKAAGRTLDGKLWDEIPT